MDIASLFMPLVFGVLFFVFSKKLSTRWRVVGAITTFVLVTVLLQMMLSETSNTEQVTNSILHKSFTLSVMLLVGLPMALFPFFIVFFIGLYIFKKVQENKQIRLKFASGLAIVATIIATYFFVSLTFADKSSTAAIGFLIIPFFAGIIGLIFFVAGIAMEYLWTWHRNRD